MLNDDSELLEPEFVDFSTYGKGIPAGVERPPRDIDEPRLWTLTDDTARFLNDISSGVRRVPPHSRLPCLLRQLRQRGN
jgi:hypothetical protein